MLLHDLIEKTKQDVFSNEDYSKPTDLTKIAQAKKFGGFACYSNKQQCNGIMLTFVANIVEAKQFDLKTYYKDLVELEAENTNVVLTEEEVEKLIYKVDDISLQKLIGYNVCYLKSIFFSIDDYIISSWLQSYISQEPDIEDDLEKNYDDLMSRALYGLSIFMLDVYEKEADESLRDIQAEFNSDKHVAKKNAFMDRFYVTIDQLNMLLSNYRRGANLVAVK